MKTLAHKKTIRYFAILIAAVLFSALLFGAVPTFAVVEDYSPDQVFVVEAKKSDGSPYSSGVATTQSVVVTMKFTETSNAATKFQYAVAWSGAPYTDPALTWVAFSETGNETTGGNNVSRTFHGGVGAESSGYYYFRSQLTTTDMVEGVPATKTTYYSDKEILCVKIVPQPIIGSLSILTEARKTKTDSTYVSYDGNSWISNDVRFTLSAPQYIDCFYRTVTDTEETIWAPVSPDPNNAAQRILLLEAQNFSEGLVGNVEFAYHDPETGTIQTDESYVKKVQFDPVLPEFQIIATHQNTAGRVETYQQGTTSSSAVSYEIRALTDHQNASGVRYFYYTSQNAPSKPTDSGVTEIQDVGGKYVYTAYTTTRNLRFMAISGSEVMHLQNDKNYETVIDDKTPIASVTATDGKGKVLDYKGDNVSAWASQSVTFLLTNTAGNASAKFEYRAEGSDSYTEMPITNSQHSITLNFPSGYDKSTLTDQKIYFRVTSAAGVSSMVVPFMYSLAKSDFTFRFEMDKFSEKEWVSNPLNLKFTTDTKDYTFGYRIQNSDPTKPLVPLVGEWLPSAETGYFEFHTALSGAVNGFAVNFYAINLAKDECKTSASTPTTLRLDTEYAKLDLKGAIYGAATGNYISEGQWVSGNITLTFFSSSGAKNVSGYKIIKLIKNGDTFVEDDRGELQTDALGNYIDSLAYTGDYYYRVKTGAGKQQTVSYRVNMDDTAIRLNRFEVKIGDDGIWMTEAEARAYLANNAISKNLFIRLFSNHTVDVGGVLQNHFVYYSSQNGTSFVKGGVDGILVYDLTDKADSGSVQFSFYLESTAVNNVGGYSNTKADTRELRFNYNRIGATLTVELIGGASTTDWNYSAVIFKLKNDKDEGSTGVFKYQYSLDSQKSWSNIPMADLAWDASAHEGMFRFGTTPVHLKGNIYFRVLNAADYASDKPASVYLMIDTTTPDALRAVNFGDVAYTKDPTATPTPTLYYSGEFQLRAPTDESYAPTSFYYSTTNATRPQNNGIPTQGDGWTLLTTNTGISFNQSSTISFYATNTHASDYQRWLVSIDNSAGMKLEVKYSGVDGSTGDGTLFTFKWAESNRVVLRANASATAVKYYYSVQGSGVWKELIDQSASPLEWHEPNIDFGYTFRTAMRENIIFKAVNKGGKTVQSGQAVVLRIDTAEVLFNLSATVDGRPYDVNTYANSGWSHYEVLFLISQTSNNPSGVTYEYALGDYSNVNPPSGGAWNALAGYNLTSLLLDRTNNGNLEGKLWIRAAKNAKPNAWTQESIAFRVDKLEPNFNMNATYTNAVGANVTVESGQWFNSIGANGVASTVALNLVNREETHDPATDRVWKNSSKVSYFYKIDGGNWIPMGTVFSHQYTGESRAKIYFRAESEAGKAVEQIFHLNIDNVAPGFKNGNGNQYSIANGKDGALNTYYVDQIIRWENESEESLAFATVNGLPLINGGIVSTHQTYLGNPGTADYGKVTIIVQDKAGNKAELKFILRPFPLTVETISLSEADSKQLSDFGEAVTDAKGGQYGALKDNSRSQYFTNLISRLGERQTMLQTEISVFQMYLQLIYDKAGATLESDYAAMSKQIATYRAYPLWQQVAIRTGSFTAQTAQVVDYQKAYERLIEQFNTLDIQMQKVKRVEDQVSLLPAVTSVLKTDYENVLKAYSAYNSLTSDQKSAFKTNLVTKLVGLKQRCEVLLLQDQTLGVEISGDGLMGGAMLAVREVATDTEDYANIQRSILASYSKTIPHALVRLLKLSIRDFGSNSSAAPTGKIKIFVEIPEDQQAYLYFSVFSVDANGGTVTRIEGVEVTADGRYVSFVTEGLGTYALASSALVTDKGNGGKVYGTILGITIDAQMIAYILIGIGGLVIVLIAIIIITGIRRRKFLKRYDRRYKQGLAARGVDKIPKGNKARRENPVHAGQNITETRISRQEEYERKSDKKSKKKSKRADSFDLDE